ncbi:MAG: hypothetical protein MZV64_64035 [Ignavibacteriales bacterium]|nr:hypothetical protein [Ignavibacteriales bacterium]
MAVWGSTGPAAPSRGQDAGKPIQHEVSVTVRLVQVYVSDKSGNAIPDLKKEDFVVYDDGVPVAVTEFERHVSGTPAVSESPEAMAATEPEAKALLPHKYFIFFDFAFNNPVRRHRPPSRRPNTSSTPKPLPATRWPCCPIRRRRASRSTNFSPRIWPKARQAVAGISAKEISGRAEEIEREYWDLRAYHRRPDTRMRSSKAKY